MCVLSSPRGVTTNSAEGVDSYEIYYPVFEAMEQENLVLNIHGEVPSSETGVSHLSTILIPHKIGPFFSISSYMERKEKKKLTDRVHTQIHH
jgi:dihydroorotase